MTVCTNPRLLPVRAENIPAQLKARPQWVVWKAVGNKPDKVPYSVRTGRKASIALVSAVGPLLVYLGSVIMRRGPRHPRYCTRQPISPRSNTTA